jgi:hypothetical protein
MEEELCFVDNTTNTILRELKYFQTLKRVEEISQPSRDTMLYVLVQDEPQLFSLWVLK